MSLRLCASASLHAPALTSPPPKPALQLRLVPHFSSRNLAIVHPPPATLGPGPRTLHRARSCISVNGHDGRQLFHPEANLLGHTSPWNALAATPAGQLLHEWISAPPCPLDGGYRANPSLRRRLASTLSKVYAAANVREATQSAGPSFGGDDDEAYGFQARVRAGCAAACAAARHSLESVTAHCTPLSRRRHTAATRGSQGVRAAEREACGAARCG